MHTRVRSRRESTISSLFAVRRWVAVGIALIAVDAVVSASGVIGSHHLVRGTPDTTSLPRALTLLAGIALLALTPRLWRNARIAASPVIAGLLVLALVQTLSGSRDGEAIAEATVALLLVSGTAILALRSPGAVAPVGGRHLAHDLAAARAIVDAHGEDSISPFILRPDKAFHFAGRGVVAYSVIGRTAVVSGDPVAPEKAAPEVLASFRSIARARGWDVVVYGASAQHLEGYRGLGMRALCAGEEALVDPGRFTLEGRAVRKLRQSVHRIERLGWEITTYDGREIESELEGEIDALESSWRSARSRIIGFAMGMGSADSGVRPGDLYLLGRAPDGELRAVMRFISHCGKLSLDTMRRVGETPNGLNEALVARALEIAREREIPEVSLNYAGLAHLVRGDLPGNRLTRKALALAIAMLSRRFQMERLVRFNDKFSPSWRPRYIVYEARAALPRAVLRVLEAEGYYRRRGQADARSAEDPWGRALPQGRVRRPRTAWQRSR